MKKKLSQKQLDALAKGREAMCANRGKKKVAADVQKGRALAKRESAAAVSSIVPKARELWAKLPDDDISLPQFKALVSALPFKTFFATQLATVDGENSVLLSIESAGYGRQVALRLVRRTGWNGKGYSDAKSSSRKYLSMRVSNGFINSPKLGEFLRLKKIKVL